MNHEVGGKGGVLDVAVIGGGQAGLATGYYLRRAGLSFVILDSEEGPGGAWRHGWDSLRAFSPAPYSSLPGWMMSGGKDEYPSRDDVLEYFGSYERHYGLPLSRGVRVEAVLREGGLLVTKARSKGGTVRMAARTVVSATGTWRHPYIPNYPGREVFGGEQTHSAHYRNLRPYAGKRVLIVGGGNSAAQVLAEVSRVADTIWVTPEEPAFLPDDVDGRVLFERATERYRARTEGRPGPPAANLANIVMVPSVKEARDRGVLTSLRPFERFTENGVVWPDGSRMAADAVIWCTGFSPALEHLAPLGVLDGKGRVEVEDGGAGTRSVQELRLWLVGYGDWTGFASATIIGVGRTARATVGEMEELLKAGHDDRPLIKSAANA